MRQFVIHVYKTNGEHEVKELDRKPDAKAFADRKFQQRDVYKVKVWDLHKGKILPGNPYAKALIYHLV